MLVILTVPKLTGTKLNADISSKVNIRLFLATSVSICLLLYFKSSFFEFSLVISTAILIYNLNKTKNLAHWKNILTLLIVINVLALACLPYTPPIKASLLSSDHWSLLAWGKNGYSQKIRYRNKNIAIKENFRELGKSKEYIFNNENWLLNKIPFSHGYNPLGNPLYWYFKNEPFVENIIMITQKVRVASSISRKDYVSDNTYAEAIEKDVLSDVRPTIDQPNFLSFTENSNFNGKLENLNLTPNTVSIKVKTNAPAYLIFNNVHSPGWSVYVNGTLSKMIITNHLFQGVFLRSAGENEIIFKYRPKLTITLMVIPYGVLFISSLIYFFYYLRKRKAS